MCQLEKLYVYAMVKTTEDLSDSESNLLESKASNLYSKLGYESSYINTMILDAGKRKKNK